MGNDVIIFNGRNVPFVVETTGKTVHEVLNILINAFLIKKNVKNFDFKGIFGSYCHSMDCEESQVEQTKKK